MSKINPNTGLSDEETQEGEAFKKEYLALKAKYGNRWAVIPQVNLIIGKVDPEVEVAQTEAVTDNEQTEAVTDNETEEEDNSDAVEEILQDSNNTEEKDEESI